ncbi:MAG: sigma-70 family RNA polymerase sigma factor [Pirellulaceae bacterium]
MGDPDAAIAQLLDQASGGDESAITEIIQHFESEIRVIARRQLGNALRPYLDSMDLVQSIHLDLLCGLRDGKIEFTNKRQLMGFVTTVVRRKAAHHWRKHRRQQRQSGICPAEEGLADVVVSLKAHEQSEFSPADLDQIEFVLNQLDPSDRQLVALRLEGYSTAEVARQLGVNPDVTRVRLSRLRKRLKSAAWFDKLV